MGIILKQYIRIFSVFLTIVFSTMVVKSYGQVSINVTIGPVFDTTTNITICPREDVNLWASTTTATVDSLFFQSLQGGVWVDAVLPWGQRYFQIFPGENVYTPGDNFVTRTYRARYFINGSSVEHISNQTSITVRPPSKAGWIAVRNYNVCIGTPLPDMVLNGTVGDIKRWEMSTNGGVTYSTISGALSTTLSSAYISNTNSAYYRAVAQNAYCPEDTLKPPIVVKIDQLSVGGTAAITAGNATICANTSAPTITLTGSVGTVQWQWSST
ncbi:MAG: hypothetical protein RL377_1044, partial [Bacteroidota bacterium]